MKMKRLEYEQASAYSTTANIHNMISYILFHSIFSIKALSPRSITFFFLQFVQTQIHTYTETSAKFLLFVIFSKVV